MSEPLRRCPHCRQPWDSAHARAVIGVPHGEMEVIGCPKMGENARYYLNKTTLEDVFAHELEGSMLTKRDTIIGPALEGPEDEIKAYRMGYDDALRENERTMEGLMAGSVKERRERIATAALGGIVARGPHNSFEAVASECLAYADALIAALDKKD